jgi:hypothetical protein
MFKRLIKCVQLFEILPIANKGSYVTPRSRRLPRGPSLKPGANPTIVSYNASVVKIYNVTSSLVRFEKQKNIGNTFIKRSSLLQRWRCSCKFQSSRIGS